MWLPDVIDPDGTRITLRVEPAHARYVRIWHRWTVPPLLLAWSDRLRQRVQARVGSSLTGGQWVVEVESDDGTTARILRATKAQALQVGEELGPRLRDQGMSAAASYL